MLVSENKMKKACAGAFPFLPCPRARKQGHALHMKIREIIESWKPELCLSGIFSAVIAMAILGINGASEKRYSEENFRAWNKIHGTELTFQEWKSLSLNGLLGNK
jgi:hypothetical protein